MELQDELSAIGFQIRMLDEWQCEISGLPTELSHPAPGALLREIISEYQQHQTHEPNALHEQMARTMARNSGIKKGKKLEPAEMKQLIDELFACENPYYSPTGQQTLLTLTLEELAQRLNG
jgi:DNA mismatch repair protein MutL